MSTNFILIVEMIKQYSQIKSDDLPICDLIILRLNNSSQEQAPSYAAKTKGASQQWYHRESYQYATFTARSHARLIGYNAVMT